MPCCGDYVACRAATDTLKRWLLIRPTVATDTLLIRPTVATDTLNGGD